MIKEQNKENIIILFTIRSYSTSICLMITPASIAGQSRTESSTSPPPLIPPQNPSSKNFSWRSFSNNFKFLGYASIIDVLRSGRYAGSYIKPF